MSYAGTKHASSYTAVLLALALTQGCSVLVDLDECVIDSDCERFGPPGTSVRYECNEGVCGWPEDEDVPLQNAASCAQNDCLEPDAGDVSAEPDTPADDEPVVVRQNLTSDTTWTADRTWILDGSISVESGNRLIIEAGTTILANADAQLVVARGAEIDVAGLVDAPVVFTSSAPAGERRPGDWRGIALLGTARVNADRPALSGIRATGAGEYGGANDESRCGSMAYSRIEFAGSDDDTRGALTMAGCGSGTVVEHLQIHRSEDDGIAILGGTVSLSNAIVTRTGGTGIQWSQGWRGNLQFIAIQNEEFTSASISGANSYTEPNIAPRSSPRVFNFTTIGSSGAPDTALRLSNATAGILSHGIIMGHQLAVDVVGEETAEQARTGALTLENSFVSDIGLDGDAYFPVELMDDDDDGGFDEAAHFSDPLLRNRWGVDPGIADPYSRTDINLVPASDAETVEAGRVDDDPFFDRSARYAGAFKPGAPPWTDGWTSFPEN